MMTRGGFWWQQWMDRGAPGPAGTDGDASVRPPRALAGEGGRGFRAGGEREPEESEKTIEERRCHG